jgi:hypothetical protein
LRYVLVGLRYGLPAVLLVVGIVGLAVNPNGLGPEAFGLFAGAAASILLLNLLFRLGASGDRERDEEESAREHFRVHGRWPDES